MIQEFKDFINRGNVQKFYLTTYDTCTTLAKNLSLARNFQEAERCRKTNTWRYRPWGFS